MAKDFVYLAVVLDLFSRRVLSWRLAITIESAFCVEALEEALAKHGRLEIFNTDQGSQFTWPAFTTVLATRDIAMSMDGKGAWRDNVFVERLWRSVKYEEVLILMSRFGRPLVRQGTAPDPVACRADAVVGVQIVPRSLIAAAPIRALTA